MATLNESWGPGTWEQPALHPILNEATATLRSVILPHDPRAVVATWSTVPNPIGGRGIALRLDDTYANVEEHFRPDELTGPNAWFLLSQLYRRLLGERVRRTLGLLDRSELPATEVGAGV